jgi:hypothetical protein
MKALTVEEGGAGAASAGVVTTQQQIKKGRHGVLFSFPRAANSSALHR